MQELWGILLAFYKLFIKKGESVLKKGIPFLFIVIFFFLIVGCSTNASDSTQPEAATDNDHEETEAEEEEEHRIVATTVAATEMFDALELDLVGIPTSYKDLPERYDGLTKVGNPMSPDMELIKSLKPTDVYSVTTLQTDLEDVFNSVDVNGTFMDLQSVEGVLQELLNLGETFNREEQAEKIVSDIEQRFAEIEEAAAGEETPSVLVLMGVPGSYLVATEHSYIGNLVKRAGGENIVHGEDVEYLASNTEYLQQSNPDIILRAAHGMPDEVVEMFDKEFKTNDIWKHFNAVKNNRVYDLPEPLFGTTGNLKIAEAMDALVEMLYPEL